MTEERPLQKHEEKLVGRNIYLDLDSLFDTRLAILEHIDPIYAISVYENGYLTRTEDAFPYLDKVKFKEIFDQRDNDILSKSLMTSVYQLVKEQILDTLDNIYNTPGPRTMELVINVWPYDIDPEGLKLILKPFYDLSNERLTVRAIDIDPKVLPLEFFKMDYSLIIMYDYVRWFYNIMDKESTITNRIPRTNLVVPKLFLEESYNERELEELEKEQMNPFKGMELLCAPIIGLDFTDILVFSALLDPDFIKKRKLDLGILEIEKETSQ
jgi:hypothetical protein